MIDQFLCWLAHGHHDVLVFGDKHLGLRCLLCGRQTGGISLQASAPDRRADRVPVRRSWMPRVALLASKAGFTRHG